MRRRVHFSLLPRCFVRLGDLISKLVVDSPKFSTVRPGYRSPHYIGIEDILAKMPCCSPYRDVQMSWEIFQCISFLEFLSQCSVQFVAKKHKGFAWNLHNVVVIFWETTANVALESHRNRWQQNGIVTSCNNVFDRINRITSIFTRVPYISNVSLL